jgi:hypothetical protein
MVYLVSIHPVGDYDRWKAQMESVRDRLAAIGVTRHWLYRGADDPDEVMVVMELPSLQHAERLLRSPEVSVTDWMDQAGLEIYPTFFVGDEVETVTYPSPAPDTAP